MPRRKLFPFVNELKAMLAADRLTADMVFVDDGRLCQLDRVYLELLANDPFTEQVWTKIENTCGKQPKLIMRIFIRDVLVARHLAAAADALPDYLARAKQAESLAAFLEGSVPLPPPVPMEGLSAQVALLNEIAAKLRERAKVSRIRRSRKDVNGSQQYILFIQLLSLRFLEMFGRYFDAEVAYLTNILFPQAMVTTDSVRSTRRPTTDKGRAGKAVAAS
jgi:hypothetical protein